MQLTNIRLLTKFLDELPEYIKTLDPHENCMTMLSKGKLLEQNFIDNEDIDSQIALNCYINSILIIYTKWLEQSKKQPK